MKKNHFILRYAAEAAINLLSYVFKTLVQLKSSIINLIYSPSPSSPWIFEQRSFKWFWSIYFSTTNKWIISSEPPGDTKISDKYLISLCSI